MNNTSSSGTDLDNETLWEIHGVVKNAGSTRLAHKIADAIARRASTQPAGAPAQAQPDPLCKMCNGTGEMDSGGTMPWGAPAMVPCLCYGQTSAQDLIRQLEEIYAYPGEASPLRDCPEWKELRAALSASPSAPAVQPDRQLPGEFTTAEALFEAMGVSDGAPAVQAEPCKFPLCQSEEYQQALAEQIKRELYTGAAPAEQATQQPQNIPNVAPPFAAPASQHGAWIAVAAAMPPKDVEVLVYAPNGGDPRIEMDTWGELYECPVPFSTQHICTGEGWASNEFEDITHWMPLPQAPDQSSTAGAAKGGMTSPNDSSAAPLEAHAGAVDEHNAIVEAAAQICDRFAARDMHPAECAGAIRMMKRKAVAASQQAPAPTTDKEQQSNG